MGCLKTGRKIEREMKIHFAFTLKTLFFLPATAAAAMLRLMCGRERERERERERVMRTKRAIKWGFYLISQSMKERS